MKIDSGNQILRVAVFYDGTFFLKVSDYYRFKHGIARFIDFPGLENFIINTVARHESIRDIGSCKIIESHFFRGRMTEFQLREVKKDQNDAFMFMRKERLIDELLMRNNTVIHSYELRKDFYTEKFKEKGIDVWLALEAYDLAVHKKFDILVLFAGDEDYVPLVRKVNSLATKVAVMAFDIEFEDDLGKTRKIKSSMRLIDEASFTIDLDATVAAAKTTEEKAARDKIFAIE
ncbi:MAG: NYN domain-containing protein [Solidesulfovibrio sp. DCME]|uniref:NYN domain-containing protein n=1 Tax=Solidesulfovibrio sp. DCME TaxID=3447380 RepID=UPI003D1132E1